MKVQVIEKKKGRIDRTTGEIIKGNLRVCAYARVSTEKEEQLNSYNSQLKYYEEKIKSNSDWLYLGIYADEGITGTLDYKRDGFMKMMQDATQNKFDMIITKSISRFGRNTVDTLKYVRALKEKGIAIYFEEERINTLEISGEIMLTVLSAMAQQESENISSHVKLGLQMKHYMQEHHEPIISERMFNQVHEILQKRGGVRGSGRRKGNFSRKYPFSSRLYCGFCGSLLTRRNWHSGTKNSITAWHCMEFVKHGKENCPHCKAMKESIIEEAFTQSYKLLCDSNKELIQTFLDEVEEIIQEESNEGSIKRLEEQKQILKEKIGKLIDLNLNGTISTETLQKKKAKLQNKINKITKEQEHLQVEIEASMSLNQGLNKFKILFKDNEIMPNFDKDVFELMIEKVIIGEKDSKGKINPRVITFILKSVNEIKCKEDKNQQPSYEASENYLQKVSEPCGMRMCAET